MLSLLTFPQLPRQEWSSIEARYFCRLRREGKLGQLLPFVGSGPGPRSPVGRLGTSGADTPVESPLWAQRIKLMESALGRKLSAPELKVLGQRKCSLTARDSPSPDAIRPSRPTLSRRTRQLDTGVLDEGFELGTLPATEGSGGTLQS